jgi:hypothetical protein
MEGCKCVEIEHNSTQYRRNGRLDIESQTERKNCRRQVVKKRVRDKKGKEDEDLRT